jgi:hypothetical protein
MEDSEYISEITIENFQDLEELQFVKKNQTLTFLFHLFGVLTFGLLYLIFHWKSLHYLLFKKTSCYIKATHILIICQNNDKIICSIEEDEFILDPLDESIRSKKRFFRFAKCKYVLNNTEYHFSRLETRFARNLEKREFYDLDSEVGKLGVNWENVEELQHTFQKNLLATELTWVIVLIFRGMIHPLSVILMVIIIICYISYKKAQAFIYFLYIVLMVIFSVIETRTKENRILEMSTKESSIKVFRRNSPESKNNQIKKCLIYPGEAHYI